MRPPLAALALLLSCCAAASAARTPVLDGQVAFLKGQIAASKFHPGLIQELTVAADKVEDTASMNALEDAFRTCRYGSQMPAQFYRAKLAELQPRIAALGEFAFLMEPKLGEVKDEIKNHILVDQIVEVDRNWRDLANRKINLAEAQAKSGTALKAGYHAKIVAVEKAFLSLPVFEVTEFRAYEQALLVPKESCNGRCDDAWRTALIRATTALDQVQANTTSVIAACAKIKSQADSIKAAMPHVPPGMASTVQHLLNDVYAALASGPAENAQINLDALLKVRAPDVDQSRNVPAPTPTSGTTVAPGTTVPDAPVNSQPSAGALTVAPPSQSQ